METMQWTPTYPQETQTGDASEEEKSHFQKSLRRESNSPEKTSKRARSTEPFMTPTPSKGNSRGVCVYTIAAVLYRNVPRPDAKLIGDGSLELFQTSDGFGRLEFLDECKECVLTLHLDRNVITHIALNPRMLVIGDEYLIKVSSSEIAGVVYQMIRRISAGIKIHPTDALELMTAVKARKKSIKKPSFICKCCSPLIIG